jgi:AcrR family transcriptional regulator
MSEMKKERDPRVRILEVATRLFYEQGYQATGINQIIAEAEVAKASFYHHFPSKEDLAVAYLQQYHQRRQLYMRSRVEAQPDPKARVLALFDQLGEWLELHHFQGCAQLNMVYEFPNRHHKIRQQVVSYKTMLREYMSQLLRAALPPETSEVELAEKTRQVYLLYEGSIVESQLYGELWPLQTAQATVKQLIEG